jgi:hypothetical protein
MQDDAATSAGYGRGSGVRDSSASTPMTAIKRQSSTIFSTHALQNHP